MKPNRLKNLLLLLPLLLTGAQAAWATGGESSAGGADDYRVTPAFFRSWQSSSQKVSICYEVAPGFGIDALELRKMIEEGFKQWAGYIHLKRLDIVPGSELIATELGSISQTCQGNENLKILFGVENDEVLKYRTQFKRPFAFTQLLHEADGNSGNQAQGLIWIAPAGFVIPGQSVPSWNNRTQGALAGLLLHELGHVFGNGHLDGTVMTPRIWEYLENDSAIQPHDHFVDRYARIDAQIELIPCVECRAEFTAAETFDLIQKPGETASDWEKTFQTLTGHAAVPPVLIHYERTGSPEGSGILKVMDANESYEFAITTQSRDGKWLDSTELFKGQGGTTFHSFAISYHSQIQTLKNGPIDVTVNYNLDGKKAEILQLGTGFIPRPVFVSVD